jgi:hypothetical protein
MAQIFRSGDRDVIQDVIPLGVRHHVRAILRFHDPRIFAAALLFALSLLIVRWIQHRTRITLEVDAIVALS